VPPRWTARLKKGLRSPPQYWGRSAGRSVLNARIIAHPSNPRRPMLLTARDRQVNFQQSRNHRLDCKRGGARYGEGAGRSSNHTVVAALEPPRSNGGGAQRRISGSDPAGTFVLSALEPVRQRASIGQAVRLPELIWRARGAAPIGVDNNARNQLWMIGSKRLARN
jgi:hypothetical protein